MLVKELIKRWDFKSKMLIKALLYNPLAIKSCRADYILDHY
jgi:hypothetical protein